MLTQLKKISQKIEWSNLLFLAFSPVIAIFGTFWIVSHGGAHPLTWVLALLMMVASGLGVTVGYHRLFSHKTFQASSLVKLFCLLFGGAAFEGPAREWCSAHRKHHQFVDTERDPYNIKKGFWHAHMFWVVLKSDQSDETNIKDLKRDPLVLFQDCYYVPLAILVGFVFPAGLAALWGDFWGGFFIAGFLRIVVNHHLTFLINSYCHYFGKQTYSDEHTARDSGFISLFTYGEGYHSFHHTFESDYRNGACFYHFDPSKWTIRMLEWFGLAFHLKRATPEKILERRLEMEAKRFRQKLIRNERLHDWEHFIEDTRARVLVLHAKFLELKTEYKRLKKEKVTSMQTRLQDIKDELKISQQNFKQALAMWKTCHSDVFEKTA